jgi:6-pyruvoyltetrahydropterin/6-carboxytetrahydropterin synthase
MKVVITRRVHFCSGHRLYNPDYDDEKNRRIFGACSNPNGHGHNYHLEVSVTGPVEPETGMVINLKEMKAIMEREIVSKVDHMNLNTDVDFMAGVIPTTENLAARIWEILDQHFSGNMLARVVVWESENNRVEITR